MTATRTDIPPVLLRSGADRSPDKRPVMLAIAGDSAAGKTTLTRGICEILGPDRVTVVCTDDYHRFDRSQRASLGITPLHPACNYVDIVEQHLALLAARRPILKPVYDHAKGSFAPPEYVEPRDFVVVEGLLPLFNRRMRDCFDVRVFLDPPEDLRARWKIARDCAKRGYRPEQVAEELRRREPDSAAFIRPQREHADMVVRFAPPRTASLDGAHLDVSLVLRPTLPHPDLSDVLEEAGPIRFSLWRDAGKPVDLLEIDGDAPPQRALHLEEEIWSRMHPDEGLRREAIGCFTDGETTRRSDPLALTQLLVVYHLVGVRAVA